MSGIVLSEVRRLPRMEIGVFFWRGQEGDLELTLAQGSNSDLLQTSILPIVLSLQPPEWKFECLAKKIKKIFCQTTSVE